MTHLTSLDRFTHVLTLFQITLFVFLPLANTLQPGTAWSHTSAAPAQATPAATDISATKTDTLQLDADGNGQVTPGDTLRYTVTITNSGSTDATEVTFNDIIDSNTTFVPDSVQTTPLAFDQAVTTSTNTPLAITLLANDPDGDTLTFAPRTAPGNGTIGTVTAASATSATITYTPNPDYLGADSFTFQVTDDDGNSNTATVGVTVTGIAPTAADDSYSVTASTTLNIATIDGVIMGPGTDTGIPAPQVVTFGPSQVNVTAHTAGAVGLSSGGNPVTVNPDGSFSYTAPATSGIDRFWYRISNGTAPDADAEVTITILETPATNPDNYVTPINTTLTVPTGAGPPADLLQNDTGIPAPVVTAFGGGSLGGNVTTNPAGSLVTFGTGSLQVNANGSFTFNPATGFTGDFTFDYQISNTAGNAIGTATIRVDAPPEVISTTPTDAATGVTSNADLTIEFSEAVNLTGDWFEIVCSASGTRTVADTAVTGGSTTFTIDPTVDFVTGESCTVTIFATQVADQDSADPPDTLLADVSFSFTTDGDAAPYLVVESIVPAATAGGANTAALNQQTNSIPTLTLPLSEPVDAASNAFTLDCAGPQAITVTPALPATASVFDITPASPLASGVTCTLTVVAANVSDSDAADPPNNLLVDFTLTFTVDAAPAVTGSTPANNALAFPGDDNLVVNFSENVAVNPASFDLQCPVGTNQPFTFVGATTDTSSVMLDPDAVLPAGTNCQLTVITAQVSDSDSVDPPDILLNNVPISFTTSTDDPPSALPANGGSVTPTDGASDIATDTSISVTFNEPVDIDSAEAFQLECPAGDAIPFSVTSPATLPATNQTNVVITPDSELPAGITCDFTIVAAEVRDSDLNEPPDTMLADETFQFTTDALPQVASSMPENGSNSISPYTNIILEFTEDVDITAGAVSLECPAGSAIPFTTTPALPASGITTLALAPDAPLPPSTTCQVTLAAANVSDSDLNDPPQNLDGDSDNIAGGNFVLTFDTGDLDVAPTVISTTPADGATGVAATAPITINFSENVIITDGGMTVTCAGVAVPFSANPALPVTTPGTSSIVLTPETGWTVGSSCVVTVLQASVTDSDSDDPPDHLNDGASDDAFTFTVDSPPTVSSTTPANGASGRASGTNLTITFSENVDLDGDWFEIVCTTSGTRTVADTLVTGGPTTFTINPAVDFASGESCTVTILAPQVTDQDSADPPDTMLVDVSFSFTIDAAPYVVVGSIVPVATGGPNTASLTEQTSSTPTLTLPFSEPVTATPGAFVLTCDGPQAITITPALPATSSYFDITPASSLPLGATCTLTVVATNVNDIDPADPPSNLLADFTLTFTVDEFAGMMGNTLVKNSLLNDVTMLTIGTLPAGKSITITFDVTIADPFPTGVSQVINQGTITGNGFADVLTDDPDHPGTADATVTPVERAAPATETMLYLPILNRAGEPDLVISALSLSPNKRSFAAGEPVTIDVTVTNQGTAAAGAFWLDLYINPSTPPTTSGILWHKVCGMHPCYGIAWLVPGLALGASITLTTSASSFSSEHTIWPGYFASGTTDLYVYVDSWRANATSGAVAESNENNNRNELPRLNVTGANPAQTARPDLERVAPRE